MNAVSLTTLRGSRVLRSTLALAASLALLASCSKEKDVEPPAELVNFKPTLKVDRVWSQKVAGDEPVLRLGLGLAVDGERVYAAGAGGDVVAFELENGRSVWRTRSKAALSGGTGAGFGLVVVGSSNGEVLAFEQSDGRERWRVKVGGQVLSAPAVAESMVIVRTVDGRLLGLDPATGSERWQEQQQIPRLTLRGAGTPAVAGNAALSGFDNGRVLAVNVADGEVLWDTAVAPPTGRTELERLVDIDSALKISGAEVFVVGYQGRAAMLALDSGQVWWSRELSSYRGLDIDDDSVFISTAAGEVVSLRRRTGVELWRQDALKRRGLSAPAALGSHIAVADSDGYLHWLDKASGALVARGKVGGRVSNAPLVAGGLLLVIDDQGHITAWRPQAAAPAPDASPSATSIASPTESPAR